MDGSISVPPNTSMTAFAKKQVSKVVWNYDGAISGWNVGSVSIGCLVHLISSVAYGGHPGCIDHFY